mgnify:CR=1 FL=1
MKNTFLTIIFSVFSTLIWSQNNNLNQTDKDEKVIIKIIEEDPIFPGCEDVDSKERKNCFIQKINEHIQKNYNYPEKARKKKITGKVIVSFVINNEGEIKSIMARGPKNGEILEEEARRIISLLPKMKPATQRGEPVNISYSIPINFNL